ncbi:MAG: 4Fe-4S dicluster domain-containing protein [Deltaproteobacteria bacterium]|nr:4Fe-4S dicluster domain-containing protein [Deltaproteobacteria bacterium]MCB9786504.1 4Fe-4S dicluster domain-containing protein [Deltaproteobacteria bacterium]
MGADDQSKASGRRDFFRGAFTRLQETALGAAREFAKASAELADAANAATEEVPRYHRARPRAGDGDSVRRVVRPPGALPEPRFLQACERCRLCIDACPENAIFRAGPQFGAGIELTPMMRPDQRPCALCVDVPCAAACPTGALVPLPSADAIQLGLAIVMDNLCLNTRGESCDACLGVCPCPGAIAAGPKGVPRVDADACTGCGLCAHHCRAYPKAIHIRPSNAEPPAPAGTGQGVELPNR